jgi:hypothetical protein
MEPTMTTRAVPWMPPNGVDVELLPAGQWWDAVRVPAYIGAQVLEQLGWDTGAVIEDQSGAVMYWLVLPGAADRWGLPEPAVAIRGKASYVAVPPVSRTDGPGLRWLAPLTAERYLTDPELLRAALAAAVDAALGRREEDQ